MTKAGERAGEGVQRTADQWQQADKAGLLANYLSSEKLIDDKENKAEEDGQGRKGRHSWGHLRQKHEANEGNQEYNLPICPYAFTLVVQVGLKEKIIQPPAVQQDYNYLRPHRWGCLKFLQ